MNKKQNARYELTDLKIREYFLNELKTKSIEQIKVIDICKGIGINRSSFYAHYTDVYSVSEKIALSVRASLSEAFKEHGLSEASIGSKDSILVTLEHVKANQNFYRAYFSHANIEKLNEHFNHIFVASASPFLTKLGIQDVFEQHYYFLFFSGGLAAIIKEWLKTSCKESPERITEIVLKSTGRQ